MDSAFVAVVLSFFFLFVAAQIGDQLRKKMLRLKEQEQRHFGVLPGATLTLRGLPIGFSFSMAVSRYDRRKAICFGCHLPAAGYDQLAERPSEFLPLWGFLGFSPLPLPHAPAALENLR